MKTELVTCLFVVVGTAYAASLQKCHFDKLDVCGEPLSDFRKEIGQKYPTTEEQVDKLCTQLDKADSCLEGFQNLCMTPMQLQVKGFLTEGAYDVYKEFCTAGSELRTNYIKHAPCMNEAHESEEYKGFTSYVEAGLEDILEKAPHDRLTTACCGYQWFNEKSTQLGEKKCGSDAVQAFQKVLDMAVSSLPDVLCQGFSPDNDECKGALPPPGTLPKGTIKNSHIAKTFSQVYLEN